MFGKLPGKVPTNITVHMFAKYKINFSLFAKLVNYCCYFLIFCGIKTFYNFINFVTIPRCLLYGAYLATMLHVLCYKKNKKYSNNI